MKYLSLCLAMCLVIAATLFAGCGYEASGGSTEEAVSDNTTPTPSPSSTDAGQLPSSDTGNAPPAPVPTCSFWLENQLLCGKAELLAEFTFGRQPEGVSPTCDLASTGNGLPVSEKRADGGICAVIPFTLSLCRPNPAPPNAAWPRSSDGGWVPFGPECSYGNGLSVSQTDRGPYLSFLGPPI